MILTRVNILYITDMDIYWDSSYFENEDWTPERRATYERAMRGQQGPDRLRWIDSIFMIDDPEEGGMCVQFSSGRKMYGLVAINLYCGAQKGWILN